jgi:acyl-[acyl-carrier-protein]-phospholipid O-acyltransferase / long-chain-fatty-acid--[acyl-carrier-protein] ligase
MTKASTTSAIRGENGSVLMSEGRRSSAVEVENACEGEPDARRESRSARYSLGFWSLVVTQFQGAFNDNALKFLVIYLVVGMSLPVRERDWLVLVVGALFALPFILFSMTGGFLADRFSKRSVTIGTKWMELGVMLFVLLALARGNLKLEAAGVFLLSSQAALFGPSKYGLLPELLPEKDLSWGNGVVELGTFLAAISATVASGFLAFYFRGHQERSGIALLGCTLLGLAASLGISRVAAANPARKFNSNPLGDLGEQVRLIRGDRVLCWAVVGNFYLWFLAALLQFTIVIYGHDILRIDERHISYLQAAVAIGIGLGSLATGYLSDAKIEYGLIPVGAVGMTVFGFLSASQGISLGRAAAYLGLLGFFGGFYAVPLNALIQHRPDPARKGGVIAAANLISFVGVFAAAGVYFALAEGLRLRADEIFFAGACMTLAATFYAVVFLPDSMLRLALWLLTHSIYRLRVEGRDNIPERGAALFVVNNLTLLEAIFLSAATDRPIRFVADAKPFAHTAPLIRRALRITHLPENDKSNGFMRAVSAAFASGEVTCLAGEAASALLEGSAEQDQVEEYLREARSPIVLVSVKGAESGPLQSEDGRLRLAPSHLRGGVTLRFRVPLAPAENLAFAEALRLLKAAPALRFSASSD